MNALKRPNLGQQLRSISRSTNEEVAVFVHFRANTMKIQVCKVAPGEIPNHLQLVFTRGAFAWVRSLPSKCLEFRFQKSTMLTHTLLQYFGYGQFILEQSMIIPKTLAYQLDLNSHWIKAGTYPVTETEEELMVTF